jgi:hypothetical protein
MLRGSGVTQDEIHMSLSWKYQPSGLGPVLSPLLQQWEGPQR